MKTLHPHPKTVILSGVPVRADLESTPVGIFDDARIEVRKLSTVTPVEEIFLERVPTGYRGVLWSKKEPYLFVMSGSGFFVRRVELAAVLALQQRLADAEADLTAQWHAGNADVQQQILNEQFMEPNTNSGTAVPEPGPWELVRQHGPRADKVERVSIQRPMRRDVEEKQPAGLSAGGLILNAQGRVLLVKPTNGHGGYDWTFPKGHLTDYELERADGRRLAALREVREETGYECTIRDELCIIKHNDGGVCAYFLMDVGQFKHEPSDGEIAEQRWCSMLEALEMLNDSKDVELLTQLNAADPHFILKSDVKHPGARGGKWYRDEHGKVQYGDRPTQQVQKKKITVAAVKIGEKPVYVHKNALEMTFLKKKSGHSSFEIEEEQEAAAGPAWWSSSYGGNTKFSEGEIDYLFKKFFTTPHKSFDAFIKKEIRPMWDDEGGNNPFTNDKAKQYVNDALLYMERAGLIANGSRDVLNDKKQQNWSQFASKMSGIAKSTAAQKYVREFARGIIANYGCTSKTSNEERRDTIAVNAHLAGSGTAAYHSWDGRVALAEYVFRHLETWGEERSKNAPGTTPDQAASFSALLHEELHGASSMISLSYRGVGQLIEEVTTEVAARYIMRDKFGHLRLTGSGRLDDDKRFQVSDFGPYGPWIKWVHQALVKAINASPDDADETETKAARMLEQASLKMKAEGVPKATQASEHQDNFLKCFPELDSTQKWRFADALDELVRKMEEEIAKRKKNP